MRKISIKNYVLALFITIITVVVTISLVHIYNNKNAKLDFIIEVSEKDLDYYIAENNNILIYMTNNKASKEINRKFKKYLKNKEIDIIYIDLNEVSDNFKTEFTNKYFPIHSSSTFVITDSTLVLIKDGKIASRIHKVTDFEQIKEFIEGIDIK